MSAKTSDGVSARPSAPEKPDSSQLWHPLSAAQRGLWIAYALQPELQGDFNVSLTMRVRPSIEPSRLQRGLEVLVARHSMLRARFGTIEGKPMQTIGEPVVPLRVVQVRSF